MIESQLYVWVSVGEPSRPPERVRVECCHDCASLIPTGSFDVHGRWHAAMERLAAER